VKGKVLLVEDDRGLADVVREALEQDGFKALWVDEANKAFSLLKDEAIDLLLLDINLPGISGLKFLEVLRSEPRTAGLPVIMLTVLGEEAHRVRGLRIGADDYLPKPFSTKELLARMDAVLRRVRRGGQMPNTLEAGPLRLDVDGQSAAVRGKPVALTSAEFTILSVLLRKRDQVVTFRTLAEALSKSGRDVSPESIYTHVKNLRRKLGPAGDVVETVHGVGYKISD